MGVNSISRDHPIANAKQVRFLAELLESPTSVQQPNISATAKQSLDGRQQSFAIFFWRNSAAKKNQGTGRWQSEPGFCFFAWFIRRTKTFGVDPVYRKYICPPAKPMASDYSGKILAQDDVMPADKRIGERKSL